jgi:hypothetical protein
LESDIRAASPFRGKRVPLPLDKLQLVESLPEINAELSRAIRVRRSDQAFAERLKLAGMLLDLGDRSYR